MATATTTVQLNVTGNAQQVLEKTQKSVQKLQDSFGKLRNAVAGLAIGAMITNMFRAADAITDLSDATGIATSSIMALRQAFALSGGDAAGAESAILKLYQSIDDAANGNDKLIKSFGKVGVTLNDIGTLSEEEILNKVIKNLGAMGSSAESVGLKMDLMGKQARSVNITSVAQQFDQLKNSAKGAEPGIVAAGKIFDNFQKFKGDFGAALAKQFSGLLTTLEKLTGNTENLAKSLAELVRIVTILGTAFLIFTKVLPALKSLGDALFVAGNAGKFFGTQMRWIFMNLKALPKNIAAFILSLVGLKDALGATAGRAGGLKSLGAALLNVLRIGLRFAGLVGIIIGVAQALNFLIKTITGFDVLDWLGEKLSYVIDKFKEFAGLLLAGDTNYFKETAEGAELTADALEEVVSQAAETRDRLQAIREENERFMDSVRDITKAYQEQNAETLQSLGNEIKYLSMTEEQIALDKQRIANEKSLKETLDQLDKKRKEAAADESKSKSGLLAQIDDEIKKVKASGAVVKTESDNKIKNYYREIEAIRARNLALDLKEENRQRQQVLDSFNDEIKMLGMTAREREKLSAVRQEENKFQDELAKIQDEQARLGSKITDVDILNFKRRKLAATNYYNERLLQIESLGDAEDTRDKSYLSGFFDRLKAMKEELKPYTLGEGLANALGSAIDNFVKTGKFKFKQFAADAIKEWAAMKAKLAMINVFEGVFNQLKNLVAQKIGGMIIGKLLGFAEGGSPPVNKPSVVGEKGPELFVPKTAGTIIPNDQLGKGKSMGTNSVSAPVTNNYNTYNISALDAKSVAQMFAENRKAIFGANKMAEREMSYAGAR